jgi:galactokinase
MSASLAGVRDALLAAGLGEAEAGPKVERLLTMSAELTRRGHGVGEIRRWFVPGRIEVLGKHTDYAGGRTLTCAAERGFCIAAAPRPDRRVVVTDVARSSTLDTALASDGPSGDVRWFNYAVTVIRRLARNFPEAATGADILLASDLPSASGISSSSALMVGIALVLVQVNGLEHDERWQTTIRSAEDMAAYFAALENGQDYGPLTGDRGVGTAGGSEDHTAVLCSRPGMVSQYRFCPTRLERRVPVREDLTFVIGSSGIAARKTGEAQGQYNRASRAAATLVELWRRETGRADRTLAEVLASGPEAVAGVRAVAARAAGGEFGHDVLADRLEHYIEESEEIVPRAGDALERGDLVAFGKAVDRSQTIAAQRLRNQVPETITLAALAREHGAIAASSFGAGFGGSVWALVGRDEATPFIERWAGAYARRHPTAESRATFFATRPGPAAFGAANPE